MTEKYSFTVRCICGATVDVYGDEIVPCHCGARINVTRGMFGFKPWCNVDYDLSQRKYNKPAIVMIAHCDVEEG